MGGAVEAHKAALQRTPRDSWREYLLANSGLPGPRGNLELAEAVADVGDEAFFLGLLDENPPDAAPVNDPREFLAFCGALGLGAVAASGADATRASALVRLRKLAEDPRWRMREAVAMALQRVGGADASAFIAEVRDLAAGTPLQKRAAVAAVADPPLLRDPAVAAAAPEVLDDATGGLRQASQRRAEDVRALRKGLGYAWSVVIVATPEEGKRRFEALADESDSDIAWVVRENLKKARLERMDAQWVARMRSAHR